MIAIIFLLISAVFGWCLLSRFSPQELQGNTIKIPFSIILGIFISVWITFLLNLFLSFSTSITITLYILFLSSFFLAPLRKEKNHFFFFRFSAIEYILLGIFLLIATFLMNQSLHFTSSSVLQIGANEWGDFDVHLPIIRSFAWGLNMPPSLPFYPNANAAYHFMFDYLSAILEYGGLPLTYAFNVASIIAFSCLLFFLYTFAKDLFSQQKIIGIFTVVLFLFNSSLEFVEAFQKLHLTNFFSFFPIIYSNNHYFSAGPYTSDIVSIIWNMNVYLNQRHLIFGFAIGIAILIFLQRLLQKTMNTNYAFTIGILIGLTPFWSIHVFICLLVVTGILAMFHIKRLEIFLYMLPIAILLALPQVLWLSHDVKSFIQINPGFLAPRPLTAQGLFTYWFYNLGVSLFTLPIGFLLASKEQKKWFTTLFVIFTIVNIFQLNSDMVNNHKLFNFWLILSNSLTAFVIYRLITLHFLWKWAVIIPLLFLLTFSGIIDMFVVKNEIFYTIADYPADTTVTWVISHTPPGSVFLLSSDSIYNPVRLAGRKTFAPSPRYADAYGYHISSRNRLIQQLYASTDITASNMLLKQNHINYIELPKTSPTNFNINYQFFKQNFPVVFSTNDFDLIAIP